MLGRRQPNVLIEPRSAWRVAVLAAGALAFAFSGAHSRLLRSHRRRIRASAQAGGRQPRSRDPAMRFCELHALLDQLCIGARQCKVRRLAGRSVPRQSTRRSHDHEPRMFDQFTRARHPPAGARFHLPSPHFRPKLYLSEQIAHTRMGVSRRAFGLTPGARLPPGAARAS